MNTRMHRLLAGLLGAALCLGGGAVSAAGASDPLRGVLCGKGDAIPDGYVPPILANGNISMTLDWMCGMREHKRVKREGMAGVFLAGRRHSAPWWNLFNFARLASPLQVDGVEMGYPDTWEQALDTAQGLQRFVHRYANGVEVSTEAFVMFARDVVVFRREVRNAGAARRRIAVRLDVDVPEDPQLQGAWQTVGGDAQRRARFDYKCLTEWLFGSAGATTLWGRAERGTCTYAHSNRFARAEAAFSLGPGEATRVDVLVGFMNWSGTFPWQAQSRPFPADTICTAAKAPGLAGVDALRREHVKGWGDYYAEGYVRVPDPRLQRLVDVANYHVRCDRTHWSFPVGIFPSHWNGRYFGFDEMYIHQGMISAGHLADARRCPDFRFRTLPDAERRVGHYGRNGGRDGAQWMWESVETGNTEGCPVGFWQQHYFHMAAICRTAWTQYLYEDDLDWLRERGYPVITGCARFFSKNMIYRDSNGSIYLGKCTDLERLGPSRENAYMTTVGAMYAMQSFAAASDVLKTNAVEAAEMRRLAEGLRASLPVDGARFVGYRGCKEETVATLAGGFPFPVFGRHDAMHARTCRHFITKGTKTGGNMYPMGSHVCPWYAGKMALSMIWLADDVEPYRWMKDAAQAIGHFGETFEINEPGLRHTPWFTTGAGTCLFAVNQMLLCDAEGELWLGMGVPKDWTDYAFRLPAYGGLCVEARVAGGRLAALAVTPRHPRAERTVRLRLREKLLGACPLEGPGCRLLARAGGEALFEIRPEGGWSR